MRDRTKDIDPANTWVISDTHFGHDNIIGFCFRPEDHEQVMVAQWRKTVPDDGTILHLGDVSYGHNGGNTRFRRLTSKELTGARKVLVRGNHDNQNFSFYRDSGFRVWEPFFIYWGGVRAPEDADARYCDVLSDGSKWEKRPYKIEFSHYQSDDLDAHSWRIHGHIHNNGYTRDGFVPFLRQHINVSVEQLRYTPVNLKLLLEAAILGKYPQTTPDQLADARQRRDDAKAASRG